MCTCMCVSVCVCACKRVQLWPPYVQDVIKQAQHDMALRVEGPGCLGCLQEAPEVCSYLRACACVSMHVRARV